MRVEQTGEAYLPEMGHTRVFFTKQSEGGSPLPRGLYKLCSVESEGEQGGGGTENSPASWNSLAGLAVRGGSPDSQLQLRKERGGEGGGGEGPLRAPG